MAQLIHAYGFLAVFAAGLTLQQVTHRSVARVDAMPSVADGTGPSDEVARRPTSTVSAAMSASVQRFNEQLEKLAELGAVVLVGAMLAYARAWSLPPFALWWFIPLLFLVLRPVAVYLGTLGEPMTHPQRAMTCWFGIRGIGSLFYLAFAIGHGVDDALARDLVTITLVTVAASIVAHGLSVRPLIDRYVRQRMETP